MQPQPRIGLVFSELNEALDSQVNALAWLISVAIEYNKRFRRNAKLLATLLLVHGEELGKVRAMSHHIDRLGVAHSFNFVLSKLRVGDKPIPLVNGRQKLREKAVGINGSVNTCLETNLLLKGLNLIVQIDCHPNVIDDKHQLGLDLLH